MVKVFAINSDAREALASGIQWLSEGLCRQ